MIVLGEKKKVLVVDDSALMRRITCDIINSDENLEVGEVAKDGVEALALLTDHPYDAVVLDINMPRMTGLELLERLKKNRIKANVVMNSTLTKNGAEETMRALELGAIDFITKPENFIAAKGSDYRDTLLQTLRMATKVELRRKPIGTKGKEEDKTVTGGVKERREASNVSRKSVTLRSGNQPTVGKTSKVIALACSTGGPKSLQSVIPLLPATLPVPMLVVQHMPAGFTKSLAERLNAAS